MNASYRWAISEDTSPMYAWYQEPWTCGTVHRADITFEPSTRNPVILGILGTDWSVSLAAPVFFRKYCRQLRVSALDKRSRGTSLSSISLRRPRSHVSPITRKFQPRYPFFIPKPTEVFRAYARASQRNAPARKEGGAPSTRREQKTQIRAERRDIFPSPPLSISVGMGSLRFELFLFCVQHLTREQGRYRVRWW